MTSIDKRIVEMDFDNSKFEKGVSQTIKSLAALEKSTELKDGSKGFSKLAQAAESFNLNNIQNAIDSINNKFSVMGVIGFSVINNLTNAAIDMAANVASALTSAITTGGSNRALNLEQAMFQFEGLGMDVAATMLDVNAAVDGTAYSLDAAAKVAAQLGASGMRAGDDMRSSLTAISGVAAMTGSTYEEVGSIFTKVAGQGRLMGDDLLRLSSRGINAAATLSQQMGIAEADVRAMVTDGEISFAMFSAAMDDAFGEHATKANETFTGALSNVKSALGRIGANFYTPFYKNARDVLNAIRPIINGINTSLGPMFGLLETGMGKFNEFASSFLGSVDLAPFAATMNEVVKAITKVFGIGVDSGEAIEKGPLQAVYALKRIANGFGNIFSSLMNILTPMKDAFSEIFPIDLLSVIESFTLKFELLTIKFKIGEKSVEGIKNGFLTFFTVAKNVATVVGSLLAGAFKILQPVLSAIQKVIGYVSAAIGVFAGVVYEGTPPAQVFSDAISKVASAISNFLTNLNNALPSVDSFKGVLEGAKTKMEEFGSSISSKIPGALEAIGNGLQFMADWAGKAKDAIGNFIGKIDWNQVFLGGIAAGGVVGALGLGGILNSIKGFFDGLKSASEGLSGVMDSITGVLDSLRETLEAYQQNLKASALLKIAGAIAILAAALVLLSTLDAGQLVSGVAAIGALMAELTAMIAVLNKIDPVSMMRLSSSLILMSGALLIMSIAMKQFAGLSWGDIAKGGVALAALSGILIGITAAMNAMKSKAIGGAASMVLISVALLILSQSLKALGSMDFNVLVQGIGAMAAIMLILAVALRIMESSVGGAVAITIISAALLILAVALERFGSMDFNVLVQGMVAVGIALAALVLAVNLMNNGLAGAAAMLIIAGALLVLSGVIAILGAMPMEMIVQGMIGFIAMLAAFTVVGLLLAPVALQVLVISAALVIFATGLLIAAAAIVVMSVGLNLLLAAGLPALGMLALLGVALLPIALLSPLLLLAGAALALLGVGLLAAGAGLLLFSATGPSAVENLLALGIAMIPMVAMAPMMAIVGAAMIVLGAAALVLGAGLLVLSLSMTLLGSSSAVGIAAMRQIAQVATELAPKGLEIAALGAAFAAFGVGALAAGAASIVLGAGLVVLSAGLMMVSMVGERGIAALDKIGQASADLAWNAPSLGIAGAAFAVFGAGALVAGAGALLAGAGFIVLVAGMAAFNAMYPQVEQGLTAVANSATILEPVGPILTTIGTAFATLGSSVTSMGLGLVTSVASLTALVTGFSSLNTGLMSVTIAMAIASSSVQSGLTLMVTTSASTTATLSTNFKTMSDDIKTSILTISVTLNDGKIVMASAMQSMATTVDLGVNQISLSFARTGPAISNGISSAISAANYGGRNLVYGFINGANSLMSNVYSIGYSIGARAVAGINAGAGNASPSHKTFQSGIYTDQGLINGMEYLQSKVEKAGRKVGVGAVDGIQMGMSKASTLLDSIDGDPVITPIVDLTNVNAAAKQLDDIFGTSNKNVGAVESSAAASGSRGSVGSVYNIYLDGWTINDLELMETVSVGTLIDIVNKGRQ